MIYQIRVPDDGNLQEEAAAIARALARRLKSIRVEKGLSKYRLARLAGIDERAITFVEEGTNVPTVENFARIALALGRNPSELLREAEEEIE